MLMQCVATTVAQKHVIRDDKRKWDTLRTQVIDSFDWLRNLLLFFIMKIRQP